VVVFTAPLHYSRLYEVHTGSHQRCQFPSRLQAQLSEDQAPRLFGPLRFMPQFRQLCASKWLELAFVVCITNPLK